MLFSILMNWTFGLLIEKSAAHKKLFLVLDIIGNLGLLGYFKYTNFILDTIRRLLPSASVPVTHIALPIGISFFTFQAMSYVIDLYRGRYRAQKNLFHLALYISFFPQLIAGPIVQYKDIEDQIMNRKRTPEKIASGIRRFIYGLGKKVIISNLVASSVDKLFALSPENMTGVMAWTAAILYTLQIYYDFSGYSDMAIGLGRMFGFEFLENFNYPYISKSIREFWRRWHISLSSWFRDYVYIPLGGNRKGEVRTYINNIIVFFLTGLWHGASWNFVGWGLYHGFFIFIIIERLGFGKILKKSKVLATIYTALVFIIGWVFFRVTSVRQGFAIVFRMLLPWRYTVSQGAALGTMVGTQTVLAAAAADLYAWQAQKHRGPLEEQHPRSGLSCGGDVLQHFAARKQHIQSVYLLPVLRRLRQTVKHKAQRAETTEHEKNSSGILHSHFYGGNPAAGAVIQGHQALYRHE